MLTEDLIGSFFTKIDNQVGSISTATLIGFYIFGSVRGCSCLEYRIICHIMPEYSIIETRPLLHPFDESLYLEDNKVYYCIRVISKP